MTLKASRLSPSKNKKCKQNEVKQQVFLNGLKRLYSIIKTQLKSAESLPLLVGIVGGSGSGKTWLADRLAKAFRGRTSRITLDDFYRDRSHIGEAMRPRVNFDHPRAIDWPAFERALRSLASGKDARICCYDFTTHCRKAEEQIVRAQPLVLVDGLWLFRRASIRRLFNMRIFVDCSVRTRLLRRLERDTQTRGRTAASVRRQFRETVQPMHRLFVEPQKRCAEIVLGENEPPETIASIAAQLRERLRESR